MGAATHAAELHRAAGVPRAATRWTQQAADWAAQCQAVKAPELVLAVAPTPLTRREREVAQLAATGLTAKEIAERRCLSHRTVENHLARSCERARRPPQRAGRAPRPGPSPPSAGPEGAVAHAQNMTCPIGITVIRCRAAPQGRHPPEKPTPQESPVPSARRLRLPLLALLASLAVLASACGDRGSSATADEGPTTTIDPDAPAEIPPGVTLVVGDQSGQIETPLRFAGLLDDLPYEVEFASFASGPLVNEAIAAGAVDLGGMGDTPALLSYASGLDTVVVGVRVTDGSGAAIVASSRSGITSLEDLDGARVAYTTGTNTHGLVLRALDSVGLTEDDVEQVDVPLTDLANVLTSGQADVAVVYEIFRAAFFEADPDAVVLAESNELVPTYSFLLAPRSSVEDPGKRAALEDLIGRIARAAEYVRAHEDEWIEEYFVGVMKQTPEAGRQAWNAYGASRWVEVGGQALADQQEQARLLYENGRLPEPVDLTRQFDPQYAARFSAAIERATAATDPESTTDPIDTTETSR